MSTGITPNLLTRSARVRAKKDLLDYAYWAACRAQASTEAEREAALDDLADAALALGDAEDP